MPGGERARLAREMYQAFASGDRAGVERLLADDFTFSSPYDVGLDRGGYFERCWPGAGRGQEFEFLRMIESGDELIVTYESEMSAGKRGRNTEVLTIRDGQIHAAEVYFGWNVS